MRSGSGAALQGCTLTQWGQRRTSADKALTDVNVVECYADGAITATWHDDTTDSIAFTSGWVNPIDCKSVVVTSGTFNFGKE